MFAVLVLMIGMRHEVGGDWGNYAEQIRLASYGTLQQAATQGDPAYSLLNWLASRLGGGLYLVNTVCAVFFSWGLMVFCRAQPRPWLALVVGVPYLVTVVAMGYTRQGTAIGFAMLGLAALSDRKLLRFVVFVALAAAFHKSAVILMPLAVLAGTRQKLWTVFWVGFSSVLFYVLLLQDSVDALTENYIGAQYDSSGAAIRVAMNAVPAALFLWFRRRFVMAPADRTFWTWMSLGALAFIGLLVISPSSTAVDRVALYWIPLQLFVLSRLPDVLGKRNGKNAVWVWAVVAYSAAVLFVWLVFATHSFAWLPYKFYPWVAIWQ
ncbi:MAG: EpsG family protein [Burkholderiaceae bacterium]|nr:EpsG family protein [Burkholderiaceae bacterium]